MTITGNEGVLIDDQVLVGQSLALPWKIDETQTYTINFENMKFEDGPVEIKLRKLTEATPFAPGGAQQRIIDPSVFRFYGITAIEDAQIIDAPSSKSRRIQFIGDSDTAAWCIQGTPE